MSIAELVSAANEAEKLGIIGLLILLNFVFGYACFMMYREVKNCRKDIVNLLKRRVADELADHD